MSERQPIGIVRRYCAGETIREIAAAETQAGRPICYETVRRRLKQAGVKLRQNRRLGGVLGRYVVAELRDRADGVSAAELIDLLGSDPKALLTCLSRLLKAGHLAVVLRSDP